MQCTALGTAVACVCFIPKVFVTLALVPHALRENPLFHAYRSVNMRIELQHANGLRRGDFCVSSLGITRASDLPFF